MAADSVLFLGAAAAVLAVATLRLSWARYGRSTALNAIGWGFALAALVVGAKTAGAWGVSVVSLWAMGAALAVLGSAALRAPAARAKASNRRVGMMPEAGEPLRLARRCATFAIVIPGGMVAAVALALATRWLAGLAGAGEADASVLALFAMPLAWSVIAFVLLMTARRSRQLALLAVACATAVPALIGGGGA